MTGGRTTSRSNHSSNSSSGSSAAVMMSAGNERRRRSNSNSNRKKSSSSSSSKHHRSKNSASPRGVEDIISRCKDLQIDRDEPAWDYDMQPPTPRKIRMETTQVSPYSIACGGEMDVAARLYGDAPVYRGRQRHASNSNSRRSHQENHSNNNNPVDMAATMDRSNSSRDERNARKARKENASSSSQHRPPPSPSSSSSRRRTSNKHDHAVLHDLSTQDILETIAQKRKNRDVLEAAKVAAAKTLATLEKTSSSPKHKTSSTASSSSSSPTSSSSGGKSPKSGKKRTSCSNDRPPLAPTSSSSLSCSPSPLPSMRPISVDTAMADARMACSAFFPLNLSRAPTPPSRQKSRRILCEVPVHRPPMVPCTSSMDDGLMEVRSSSQRDDRSSRSSGKPERDLKLCHSEDLHTYVQHDVAGELHQELRVLQERFGFGGGVSSSNSNRRRRRGGGKSVRFTEPLVTRVTVRPRTDPEDVPMLFFCEEELWELEVDRINRIYEEQVECIAVQHPQSKQLCVSVTFPNRLKRNKKEFSSNNPVQAARLRDESADLEPTRYKEVTEPADLTVETVESEETVPPPPPNEAEMPSTIPP